MPQSNYVSKSETLCRLGSSYTAYRLFLSLGLLFILLTAPDNTLIETYNPYLVYTITLGYSILCGINFLTFKYYKQYLQHQLFIYLMIDIISITSFLFLASGPNVVIILLYMVVVLSATMLLTAKKALILTLLSILAVVYQQFFFSLFNQTNNLFIGMSTLIALVFMVTYALGRMTTKRIYLIETLAKDQRKEIVQLQHINKSIVEQLDTGFLVINDEGHIITLNEAGHELLHIPIQVGRQNLNLADLHPGLFIRLKAHYHQQNKGLFHFQHSEEHILSIQYRPIASQQQNFTLLVIESLQKINQHVQQLKLASLGQLSASIAHEIRNPLAAISQANELLADNLTEEQQLLSQIIFKQCGRINRIIEDTLSMSRRDKTVQEEIVLDSWFLTFINEDLNDVKRYIRRQIEEQLIIFFDPHQLRLILINLIRNAIRHGHEKSPGSQVKIIAQRAGDLIYIEIIDKGTGVSTEQLQNLFEPFHSTSTNGTGLGLYLAKTFCEANHARLKYIPKTHGACFRIECLATNNNVESGF